MTPTDKSYKVYLEGTSYGFCKFYFQHLDETQRAAFIAGLNEQRYRINYPGYFYVLPFFVKRGA